jgi:hypothetical protein
MTQHKFQTPHVEPLENGHEQDSVMLRVAPSDAARILRALEEATLIFAPTPGGSCGATAYRRLAAQIRDQARLAPATKQPVV